MSGAACGFSKGRRADARLRYHAAPARARAPADRGAAGDQNQGGQDQDRSRAARDLAPHDPVPQPGRRRGEAVRGAGPRMGERADPDRAVGGHDRDLRARGPRASPGRRHLLRTLVRRWTPTPVRRDHRAPIRRAVPVRPLGAGVQAADPARRRDASDPGPRPVAARDAERLRGDGAARHDAAAPRRPRARGVRPRDARDRPAHLEDRRHAALRRAGPSPRLLARRGWPAVAQGSGSAHR